MLTGKNYIQPHPSLLSKKNVKKVLAPKCPNILRKYGPNPLTSFLIKMGTTYSTTTTTTSKGGAKSFLHEKKGTFSLFKYFLNSAYIPVNFALSLTFRFWPIQYHLLIQKSV